MSRPTWRNTSFNASHLVRPAQLHHRYCPSRDRPLISQDVPSPMPHLSFGTVLKDILRHSCLIAVTRPSDRYLTSASVAFCRRIWHSRNMHIIIISIITPLTSILLWIIYHYWIELLCYGVCAGPTMKLRRGVVLKIYRNTIDAFYEPW